MVDDHMRGDGDSYYRSLGVDREATHDDIVRAYRRMAMGAHPDAHPDDPEAAGRFLEITEAYEVLADTERRAVYDRRSRGTAVQVPVRHTARADANLPDAGTRRLGGREPVVLGASRTISSIDVPLRAGPVRVTRGDEPATAGSDPWMPEVHDLVCWVVEQWWRR